MDDKIIELFKQIKKYFFVIVCLMSVSLIFNAALFLNLLQYRMDQEAAEYEESDYPVVERSNEEREKYLELLLNKDYNQLLTLSSSNLKLDPENQTALWAKADALFRLNEFEQSKEAFLKLKELAPAWHSNINPYLEQIEKNLNKEKASETP